ncbi:MAG: hypothetical protein CMK07_00065 [Ponticaulis sp.]|nr:hypothetical protein [Ponticaulis sp.]
MHTAQLIERAKTKFEGGFLEHLFKDASENDIGTRAAALSLYSMMSVFPFIAILVWIATISGNAKEAHLFASRFSIFLPTDFAELLHNEIEFRMSIPVSENILLVIFHFLLLMMSAGASLRSLLFSFREIARADDSLGVSTIILRSFLFVFPVIAFVFIASMIVGMISYIVITITAWMQSTWLITPLLWILVTLILVGFLNGVYASSLIGHQSIQIHGWLGSAVAAALISVVTIGLTMYFQINPVNREWYGSPGFLINVLLWLYACAMCLLLGAQINAVRYVRTRHKLVSEIDPRESL